MSRVSAAAGATGPVPGPNAGAHDDTDDPDCGPPFDDPRVVRETAWRACVDQTTTNYEWSQCGGAYTREADASLNAKWAQLMAVVDGETKADLVAEERAWVAYRETACKFHWNGDWGREGEVLHGPGCLAGVIERRTKILSSYMDFVTQK